MLYLTTHCHVSHSLRDARHAWLTWRRSMGRIAWIWRLITTYSGLLLAVGIWCSEGRRCRSRTIRGLMLSWLCYRLTIPCAGRSGICAAALLLSSQSRICSSAEVVGLTSIVPFSTPSTMRNWGATLHWRCCLRSVLLAIVIGLLIGILTRLIMVLITWLRCTHLFLRTACSQFRSQPCGGRAYNWRLEA